MTRIAKGKDISVHDIKEVMKFEAYLRRRFERPDEPQFQAYAEIYGEVVFEDASNASGEELKGTDK